MRVNDNLKVVLGVLGGALIVLLLFAAIAGGMKVWGAWAR